MPEDQVLPSAGVSPEQQSKGPMIFLGFAALFALLAVLGAWVYFSYIPRQKTNPYSAERTPFSVLVQENKAFAEADLLYKDGRYSEARAKYQEALQFSKDSGQEGQIKIKIAHTYLFERNLVEAVKQYRMIALNENYNSLNRAYAVVYMGMAYDFNGDPQVAAETFREEPFASLYVPTDIGLSYRRLYEYAASIYPLALAELRIANALVLEVAARRDSISTEEKAAQRIVLEGHLQRADADIARLKSDPNESSVLPEIYKRKAILMGNLAIGGVVTHEEAEQAYSDALLLAATQGPSGDGFMRYFYALYLSRVEGREADVVTTLSPLYSDPVYVGTNLILFFESEKNDRLKHKTHLVRMAGIDPSFERFLMSHGWAESDFN